MKNKNIPFHAFVLMAFVTALFATNNLHATKHLNGIVAIVNEDVITELDLDRAMDEAKNELVTNSEPLDRGRILNKLIDDMLLNQLVGKADIKVSDDDLARTIAGVLHQNRISLDQLKEDLRGRGMTYVAYKKQLENEIKRIKFVNQIVGPQVKISEQDLRDYYQLNQEKFRGNHKAHIAQIVFPLAGIKTEAEFLKLRDLALRVVSKIKRGKGFAEMAIKYSKGPNAEAGGDLGMIDISDLDPAIATVVKRMKIGDVSRPVLTGNTVAIVKLISLPEISADDFDRLRDEIYAELYDERIDDTMSSYLQKERQRAFIEIR